LDFRLDLPVLPSLSASSSCLCLASHHICCRWTTSGYLAYKYNKHQLGSMFNPLNAELNPICHSLALLGGATIVVVSRLRVNYIPWSVNFNIIENFIFQ
jgi:hypothetical protein